MRITYRYSNNKDYWTSRWNNIPADLPMKNSKVYPLKYALKTVLDNDGRILEAGCGAGRILRYFHDKGFDITGIDFIDIAIKKLKEIDSTLKVEKGDISSLHFSDSSFDYIFAFGLFHNLESNIDNAVQECNRVLSSGGKICVSFRADNIQTQLTDWLTEVSKNKGSKTQEKYFHKMNLTKKEFISLFTSNGFHVEYVSPVVNMPILYKFSFFRHSSHKRFNENKSRTEGYRLSYFGKLIQKFLMKFFPDQFCNIYVLLAQKK